MKRKTYGNWFRFEANGTGAALCDIGAFEAQQINADFPEIVFSERLEE